jgi:hypothetical protein
MMPLEYSLDHIVLVTRTVHDNALMLDRRDPPLLRSGHAGDEGEIAARIDAAVGVLAELCAEVVREIEIAPLSPLLPAIARFS